MITDYVLQNGSIVAMNATGATVFVIPQLDDRDVVDQLMEYCELMEHEVSGEIQ